MIELSDITWYARWRFLFHLTTYLEIWQNGVLIYQRTVPRKWSRSETENCIENKHRNNSQKQCVISMQ